MKKILAIAFLSASLYSCKEADKKPDILQADIDSTVKPGDNFFLYANGGWLKRNPIPGSEGSWSIANLVQNEIFDKLKKINDDAAGATNEKGTISQKIGDFWKTAMDTVALDKAGLSPLKSDLDKISAIKNIEDLMTLAADFNKKGVDLLFNDYIAQDDKNSEVMVYRMDQGGLGMPDRDYYFNNDSNAAKVRDAYKHYLTKTFDQLGDTPAQSDAEMNAVMKLETALAKASRTKAETRDPIKNYNKMDMVSLNKVAPNIDWNAFTKNLGITKLDSVVMGQPEFYTALSNEIKSTSIDDWKSYLRFHLIQSYATYLDKTSFDNYFAYRQSLSGQKEPRARWKRVLDAEKEIIGEALGQLFVKEYFSETAKKRYSDMVEAIRDAYKARIQNLTWMSDDTKQKALAKLSAITKKVGYPDKWKDFSAMTIDRSSYVANIQHGREWWHNYNINKLGKPVDRTEWDMVPQEYNAYYNPSNNEIVLPAAIFTVPGYKDEELDDALVYGYAAASTIGHEITHGFDDQGRLYDAKGNLVNWWTSKDSAEFTHRASFIIKQFSEFVPVYSLHVKGDVTQGENIADLGGLLLGLDAFKKTEAYKKNEKIGGFTPLQRYFLGYALGWMSQSTPELLATQVTTNEHAPAKERVNGPMVNIPEFYEAFGIKPGDKMYRADSLRVSIW